MSFFGTLFLKKRLAAELGDLGRRAAALKAKLNVAREEIRCRVRRAAGARNAERRRVDGDYELNAAEDTR